MVDTQVKFVGMYILGEVDKTCTAVFEDIIDQFLHDTEDDQFLLALQPVLVFMEAAAGVDASRSADLLEQVVDGRFQAKIL